jgi:GST-like protein
VKVTVMLEELLALGHTGAEYDAWLININEGDQFGSGFVVGESQLQDSRAARPQRAAPVRVFESGAILQYLAEKFGAFLPTERAARAECLSWLFWQMGSAPVPGRRLRPLLRLRAHQDRIRHRPLRHGSEAPARRARPPPGREPLPGGQRVHHRRHGVWPWYGTLAKGELYEAGEFLSVGEYKNVLRWTDEIAQRPAVQRGRMVNRTWGQPESQLHERHDAGDFDTRTQDKLATPS